MKSLAAKIFAFIFILSLSVGCASSITAPGQPQQQTNVQKKDNPTPDNVRGNGRVDQNMERPDW